MPKTIQYKSKPTDIARFQALIDKNSRLIGIEKKCELANVLGISRSAFYKKYREPDRFTRLELRLLFRFLQFSDSEKSDMI